MLPFVSIIVIVYNMKDTIYSCLSSLINLNYPKDKYEIVVVDGGSNDGTIDIINMFNVKLIFEFRRGRGLARNVGLKFAQGDIIAFIDADCIASKNWLIKHVIIHKEKKIGAVAGSVVNPNLSSQNVYTRMIHYENFSEFDISSARRYVKYIPTCNASFKKNIMQEAGYFEEKVDRLEDFLLAQNIVNKGYFILFDPCIPILHIENELNALTYISTEYDYGKWYYISQIILKNRFGRLPVNKIFTLLFAPSIILLRIVRELYKLKYVINEISFNIIFILIAGGIVWGCSYVKHAIDN